jgi:hypothetical protein
MSNGWSMSALPLKADIHKRYLDVRLGPQCDIRSAAIHLCHRNSGALQPGRSQPLNNATAFGIVRADYVMNL